MEKYRIKLSAINEKLHKERFDINNEFINECLDFQIEDSSDIKMLLREGNASQEIVEYVDGSECDMIILGSNSQSKISELLLGSTSKAVIKNSKIPVLVIPLVN